MTKTVRRRFERGSASGRPITREARHPGSGVLNSYGNIRIKSETNIVVIK